MKKNIFFSSVLLLLSLLLSPIQMYGDDITLKRALDGETLELTDGRVIRLIGVATNNVQLILSERFKASYRQMQSMSLSSLSAQAMNFMDTNVGQRPLILSFDSSNAGTSHFDENGRLLAYVWYSLHLKADPASSQGEKGLGYQTQDRLLNSELIKMGLGFVDTRRPFIQKEVFLRFEKEAAEKREGVWRSAQELYQDILTLARGARAGSVAGFVTKDTRDLSFRNSWQKFADLIRANPRDYRPYYERSWLGANPLLDRVSSENLQDIDQAILLSPFDPKCQMQRHFLLRLLGRHTEATDAYQEGLRLATKLGMKISISDLVSQEINHPFFLEKNTSQDMESFIKDALRASANEDHFLLFMSRYKAYGETPPEDIQAVYKEISARGRFQEFLNKYQADISTLKTSELIYKTHWAQKGSESPEEVIHGMETFGFMNISPGKIPQTQKS
ncbi:MAG: thermonuclease family protein [Candidatus Omnitrophica bacterium]|nr:thermonuclease family protein [Candidatus Omnitrophota bacterium]